MLQIYALVVAVNIIMGTIIIFDRMRGEGYDGDGSFIHNNTFTLTLSIFAGIIAISSLMSPYGELTNGTSSFAMLPVLGDLFPSIATLTGFFVFLARYLKANYPEIYTDNSFFLFIENGEIYIGIFCLTMATLHFFFPRLLLL